MKLKETHEKQWMIPSLRTALLLFFMMQKYGNNLKWSTCDLIPCNKFEGVLTFHFPRHVIVVNETNISVPPGPQWSRMSLLVSYGERTMFMYWGWRGGVCFRPLQITHIVLSAIFPLDTLLYSLQQRSFYCLYVCKGWCWSLIFHAPCLGGSPYTHTHKALPMLVWEGRVCGVKPMPRSLVTPLEFQPDLSCLHWTKPSGD